MTPPAKLELAKYETPADITTAPRPPEHPLEMLEQELGRKSPRLGRHLTTSRVWRKAIVGVGAALVTVWAGHEMFRVLDVVGMTVLEWMLLGLFVINVCWISFAFVSASAGFIVSLLRLAPAKQISTQSVTGASKTAVLFPIYNEDTKHIFATVEATATALAEVAPGRFECFILSDTTDPDTALAEETAFLDLQGRLPGGTNIFYRRRTINLNRKPGNIQDFVTRWGGRYDYMIVFDADSYMEAETIIELVRRMDASPETGLIQTIPHLVGGTTLFARMQQFAAAVYGPVFGAGIAWWAQDEGNFWGHNGIIRVKAFAQSAGLPKLPGKAPFGGTILSHDFVEAALLRRAGWRVRIAPDLKGSFEQCPPTIIDLTVRDRRWCQGNLQHVGVLLRGRGISWTNRLHLLMGVMSYLASPMWLLLILVGMALSLQARFLQPEYFTNKEVLFPNWPVIDPARALTLFGLTMAILFAPKLYGLILALLSKEWRHNVGWVRTISSACLEAVISALVAPILMAAQTSAVLSIVLGRDTGWRPQKRSAGGYSPLDIFRRHIWTTALGVALLLAAMLISPIFAAWLAPAAVGLVLAGVISIWTGSSIVGAAIRKWGLLTTPAEAARPKIVDLANSARTAYEKIDPPNFGMLLSSPEYRLRHKALTDAHWPISSMDVHAPLAFAIARCARARTDEELIQALAPEEKMALLNAPEMMEWLSQRQMRPNVPATNVVDFSPIL